MERDPAVPEHDPEIDPEVDLALAREARILAGIERRNRRMLRTALALVGLMAIATTLFFALLPEPPAASTGLSREQAVAQVLAQDPVFATAAEFDPQAIGQADWWKAEEVDGTWQVTVRLGWGDCQAGCISEHLYRYEVRGDEVVLIEEYGDPISSRG